MSGPFFFLINSICNSMSILKMFLLLMCCLFFYVTKIYIANIAGYSDSHCSLSTWELKQEGCYDSEANPRLQSVMLSPKTSPQTKTLVYCFAIKAISGAQERAQLVKYLSYQPEDLSLNLEVNRSLDSLGSQPSLTGEPQIQGEYLSQKKQSGWLLRNDRHPKIDIWSPHPHTYAHIQKYTHAYTQKSVSQDAITLPFKCL